MSTESNVTKKRTLLTRVELYEMYREATLDVDRLRAEHKVDVGRDSNAKMTIEYHTALERRTVLAIAIANMVTGVEENRS